MKNIQNRRGLAWRSKLPEFSSKGGVYIVKSGSTVLYVGQSCRMQTRLFEHSRRMQFLCLGADSVQIIPCDDMWARRAMEKQLQRFYKPPLCVDAEYKSVDWAWCEEVSPKSLQYRELSDTIIAKREPGAMLLRGMGLERVVSYRAVPK